MYIFVTSCTDGRFNAVREPIHHECIFLFLPPAAAATALAPVCFPGEAQFTANEQSSEVGAVSTSSAGLFLMIVLTLDSLET